MKKFKRLQVEYSHYPSQEELNKEREEGWEFMDVYHYDRGFLDSELGIYYAVKIYIARFKKEIN